MKITQVEPIVLRLPEIDVTRSDGTQDAFLVRVHTDEGITGIGEADTSPYPARTIVEMPPSHSAARGLNELLVGENPLEIDRLWHAMFLGSDHYGGAGAALHAISAIDMALYDIAGKAYGCPVSQLLGGRTVDRIPVYASEVMPDTPAEVTAIAERAVAAGYRALKFGWGPLGRDLSTDVALVTAARDAIGPSRSLMIDGGRAYTVYRAKEFLRELEDARLYWLEEPLRPDDVAGYRRLAEGATTRIATGEIESGIRPFRRLVEEGGIDVLQPDLGHCGGPTVGRQVAALAREANIEVVPHCFKSGILVAASLHLASTLHRPTFSEFSVAPSPLASALVTPPFVLEDGCLAVPEGPGLGVELDEAAIAHFRVP